MAVILNFSFFPVFIICYFSLAPLSVFCTIAFYFFINLSSYALMFLLVVGLLVVIFVLFILCGLPWASWFHDVMYFIMFGELSTIIALHILSALFSTFSLAAKSNYICVRISGIIPQLLDFLFYFFHFIFLFVIQFWFFYWTIFKCVYFFLSYVKSIFEHIEIIFISETVLCFALARQLDPFLCLPSLCWNFHLLTHIISSTSSSIPLNVLMIVFCFVF